MVPGNGAGSYEYRLTNFTTDQTTYIRAYAINHKGTAYGETQILYLLDFLDRGDYIELGVLGIAVQKKDVGKGNQDDMSNLCENSTVGGYTDWRLPNDYELASLYELRARIGNFDCSEYYWSSSYTPSNYFVCINFSSGHQAYYGRYYSFPARAVRTLTK